jgi:hypothetical protein
VTQGQDLVCSSELHALRDAMRMNDSHVGHGLLSRGLRPPRGPKCNQPNVSCRPPTRLGSVPFLFFLLYKRGEMNKRFRGSVTSYLLFLFAMGSDIDSSSTKNKPNDPMWILRTIQTGCCAPVAVIVGSRCVTSAKCRCNSMPQQRALCLGYFTFSFKRAKFRKTGK